MSTIAAFERSVSDLTRRVQKLHNGDFVSLSFHSGSWRCSTAFTGIRSGAHATPGKALADFIEELWQAEVSAGIAPLVRRSV